MSQAFYFSSDAKGVGTVIFDTPNEKVNVFTEQALMELESLVNELSSKKELKAVIFQSGKLDTFIVGADLHVFEKAFNDQALLDRSLTIGHRVFDKISALPFPTIAYINGVCVGGGLEMALACTYRVVSDHPKTSLGLPETTLGVFPAWGGTNRLPRLIGLTGGMKMILTGKPVNALKAYKMHLADAIIPCEFQEIKLLEFVSECQTLQGKKKILSRRSKKSWTSYLLETNPIGRALLYKQSRKQVLKKTKGHYPAPLVAIEALRETYPLSLPEGLSKEIKMAKEQIPKLGNVSKHLINLFFIQEALKKDSWVDETVQKKPMSSAGVIGAGTMGSGLTWLFSQNDYSVRMKDVNWEIIGKGYGTIQKIYQKLIKIKKLKRSEASLKFHKISSTTDYSGFHHLDIVLEAATENLELKQKIFAELEENVRTDTLIASNTSSLTIEEMIMNMKYPERFLAMHFFNPVDRMPLVEIVPGKKTSPEIVAAAVEFCKKVNKTPIVVGDCPGFLVNRIFVLGANETCWMLQEGVSMDLIEKTMLDFGMPMTPFVLSDEVGNDVGYKVSKVFEKAYGSRMKCPDIIKKMYDNQLFGKKTGKGFYIYRGKKTSRNTQVQKLLIELGTKPILMKHEDILDRVLFSMVNEATRCLEEEIIHKPEYLDMALIMGTGFPPFRGGLLRYADERGIKNVVDQLKRFQEKWGDRFKPTEYLLEMERNHKTFFTVLDKR